MLFRKYQTSINAWLPRLRCISFPYSATGPRGGTYSVKPGLLPTLLGLVLPSTLLIYRTCLLFGGIIPKSGMCLQIAAYHATVCSKYDPEYPFIRVSGWKGLQGYWLDLRHYRLIDYTKLTNEKGLYLTQVRGPWPSLTTHQISDNPREGNFGILYRMRCWEKSCWLQDLLGNDESFMCQDTSQARIIM
jgi:hypothetical protein